jgi:hypothetical protein
VLLFQFQLKLTDRYEHHTEEFFCLSYRGPCCSCERGEGKGRGVNEVKMRREEKKMKKSEIVNYFLSKSVLLKNLIRQPT